jgi:GNAT superfamily N-acetyltransferase
MVKHPTGLVYLEAVTTLLQRFRIAHRESGIFEAADLQWWWRKDQHHDPRNQMFWEDGAAVITDWGSTFGCDLLGIYTPEMIDAVASRLESIDRPVEMEVRDDDESLRSAVRGLGFEPTSDRAVTTAMTQTPAQRAARLLGEFRLCSRQETENQPHHMIARSGPAVAERLAECSIYRKDLDLLILGPNDEVAAYALFWADPVTGVGLVEPVRTEAEFQGRGLASALIDEGGRRLEAVGCTETKVTFVIGNEAARRAYLGRGFAPSYTSTTFRYEPRELRSEHVSRSS